MKSKPVKVVIRYEQYGYENLTDKEGDVYESDDEFIFPDGFFTV
jgi:hypothetical protein